MEVIKIIYVLFTDKYEFVIVGSDFKKVYNTLVKRFKNSKTDNYFDILTANKLKLILEQDKTHSFMFYHSEEKTEFKLFRKAMPFNKTEDLLQTDEMKNAEEIGVLVYN